MDDRIRGFLRRLDERRAERSVPTAHGVGRLADSTPDVYDDNYLWVDGPAAPAAVLAAEADGVLEARFHRRLVVDGGGAGLADELAALGYALATHLVLVHRREPDRRVDTSTVREVPLEEVLPARTEATLAEPWGDEEIARQLNEAKRRSAAAVPTRFFAAFADGEVAGYCELREAEGVAQVEDVEVLGRFRGRGLGRAVVQHALDEARRTAELVFLEALADDWPRELYAKLGFAADGRRDVYTRLPHALTRLRLRTPRLELRLATVAELRALFAVAEAGIHDPAEMPFERPWTDALDEEAFLAYHAGRLEDWRPGDWHLELVVFHEGRPVGVQGIHGWRDGGVSTGSWLEHASQGRGLGTEMRTAVLVLAFEHLGAERALSGALARNEQSLGVSLRLGYRVIGSHAVSPRGEEVEHTDLELRHEDFTSPVAVSVTGFERLRPLFG